MDLTSSRCLHRCRYQHVCLATSTIAATPPRFHWSYVPAVYQLLVHGIRGMPVLLHREVSKPTLWVHRKLMVQGSQFDHRDFAHIWTRDRMIVVGSISFHFPFGLSSLIPYHFASSHCLRPQPRSVSILICSAWFTAGRR